MKRTMILTVLALAGGTLAAGAAIISTDSFGSGANSFSIDFVTVGNAGNAHDAGDGGGSYSSTHGGVGYAYRIGMLEISQDQVNRATASGLLNVTAGAWTGGQPAARMTWYEAAAFVNWLNTSKGYQAAYDLTFSGGWAMNLWSSADAWQFGGTNLFRHKNAYYFLPSEDEWYKAAYHQNDGVTANYWDYATAANATPTAVAGGTNAGTAVYNSLVANTVPATVDNAGGPSPYGTLGQNGNAWEWNESASDGINTSALEQRTTRGGYWYSAESDLRSSSRGSLSPWNQSDGIGFRVASIPEPASTLTMLAPLAALALRKRTRSAA